jgi:hypothetical protein
MLPALLVAGLAISTSALGENLTPGLKGKTRPMTTEQLMEAIVKPHMTALKKGLVESKPESAKDWKKLALSAALLNESSYIMMADGRCPDKIWADACIKDLREGTAAALNGIKEKNIEATLAGFKKAGASCKACHTEHKPKD